MTQKCPNCGTDVADNEAYCPNCGEKMFAGPAVTYKEERKQVSPGAQTAFNVLAIVLLVIVGIPSCLLGGCFLIMGGTAPGVLGPPGASSNLGVLGLGVLGLTIFGLLVWWVVRNSRRK